MKVKPLYDRILVERIEETETTRGGIIIPDTAKEKPQEGVVLAVGPGRFEDGNRIPLDVKVVLVGERILYYLLSSLDPDFAELFKVPVDFEDSVDATDDAVQMLARTFARHAVDEELRHLDRIQSRRRHFWSKRFFGFWRHRPPSRVVLSLLSVLNHLSTLTCLAAPKRRYSCLCFSDTPKQLGQWE